MSETMTDTLPSSMTVDVEPTREHLAEQLFVAERDLAQAKRAILQLEAERDEAKQTGLFPHAKEVRQSIYRETAEVARLKAELDKTREEWAKIQRLIQPVYSSGDGTLHEPSTPRTTPKKPRPDLIPAEALLEAGWCMAGGLERDDADGQPWYMTAPRAEARRKYRRSLLRHVLSWYAGEHVDSDSRRSPLAHIICNAAILLWLERRK